MRQGGTRVGPNIKMHLAVTNTLLSQGHIERRRWHERRIRWGGGAGMELRRNQVRPIENGRELLERIEAWQSRKTQLHEVGAFVGRPVITLGRISNDLIVDNAT